MAISNHSIRFYKKKRYWALGALIIAVLFSIIQGKASPSRFMNDPATQVIYALKSGRILDAKTGEGLPDATVMVGGFYRGDLNISLLNIPEIVFVPAGRAPVRGGLFRFVTTTDKDGLFTIPDMRDHAWNTIKTLNPQLQNYSFSGSWMVRVIKPGYALEGDKIIEKFDENDLPIFDTASDIHANPYSANTLLLYDPPGWKWSSNTVEIAPIKMKHLQSNLKAEFYYYSHLLSSVLPNFRFGTDDSGASPAGQKVQRELKEYFVAKICALDPQTIMGSLEVDGMERMVPDAQAFLKQLGQMEPGSFKANGSDPIMKSAYDHPAFRAVNVCNALRLGEDRS